MRLCLASSWRVRLGLLLVALTVSTGLVVPAWSATVDGSATMAGTLTRVGGGAASGVTVHVTTSAGAPVTSATTDTAGAFTLAGLAPGGYHVEFTGPDIMTTWYGGQEELATAADVTVGAHVTTNVSAALDPAGHITGSVSHGDSVTAFVQDGTGQWVPTGDPVSATPSYSLSVTTRKPVRVRTSVPTFSYWYGGAYTAMRATSVRVDPGQTVTDVDIDTPATATISGRVTNSFGAPIAARLLVYALDGSGRLDVIGGSLPVAKAGYDLQVPAGHVTVEAVPYDSFQFFYPAWLDGVGPATATWLDLAAGDTRSVHDIAMGGGRTYRGRVTDTNGVGVDKVEVTAVQDGVVYSRTTTAADGSYALPGLGNNAVGGVLIRYSRDGVIPEWYNDAASEAAAQPVNNLPTTADPQPLSTTVAFDAGRALMTTAAPRLVGTFTYGDRMYAVPATWNVEPDHREFHWYCNGQFTGAVGESFAPRDGVDDHCALTVREIATKDGYQSGITESSNPVPLIHFGASTAPRVTGAATVGSTLTASPTTWNLPDTEPPTYQWLRDGVAIRGATAHSYRPVAADVGHRLSVTAAARRHGRSASSTSTRTALVQALSKMTATASPGLRTVAATAVLSTAGTASPGGRVVVKKGATVVTSVAVTRTPLKVPVRLRMARGWHTLTFSYGGSSRATPVTRGVRFFVK